MGGVIVRIQSRPVGWVTLFHSRETANRGPSYRYSVGPSGLPLAPAWVVSRPHPTDRYVPRGLVASLR